MVFRTVLATLLAGAILAIEMVTGSAESQVACNTPVPSDVHRFKGNTPTVTKPFVVETGVLRVTGSYDGGENFIVVPYTSQGREISLFNELGPFSGEAVLEVDPGTAVILEIDAVGAWRIVVMPAFS